MLPVCSRRKRDVTHRRGRQLEAHGFQKVAGDPGDRITHMITQYIHTILHTDTVTVQNMKIKCSEILFNCK